MARTTGITADDIRSGTITDAEISPAAALKEAKLLFDIVAGHNHNGVNSRLITGLGGGSPRVIDSSFTGVIDGVNATFTLPNNFLPNSVAVFRGGIRQKRVLHFNEVSPNKITFTSAPPVNTNLIFDFEIA